MKKLKIIVVSVLALVLCLMCVTTSTFSWFPRPKENKGSSLGLDFDYAVSDGAGISMNTYASADGINYSEAAVTDFSNSSVGLASNACAYYRTDILNSGTVPQSVSLYISQLTMGSSSSGNFFLGVNDPLKTYKQYPKITNSGSSGSTTYTTASNGKMRVYFKPNGIWDEKEFVVFNDSSWTADMTLLSGEGGSRVFYADIPNDKSSIYFAIRNRDESKNFTRTKEYTISSLNPKLSSSQSLVFDLQKGVDSNGYMNLGYSSVTGAYIANYYRTINIPVGSKFNASLNSSTDYAGNIKYYDDDSHLDIFIAKETTGEIEAKAVGTSKLYTKVVGEYGDAFQVETTVNVVAAKPDVVDTGSTDIPIVTNVKVGGLSEENKPGVVSVYWFIKNDSDNGPLKYSIRDIYLTL